MEACLVSKHVKERGFADGIALIIGFVDRIYSNSDRQTETAPVSGAASLRRRELRAVYPRRLAVRRSLSVTVGLYDVTV